jgi:hypothetical protein
MYPRIAQHPVEHRRQRRHLLPGRLFGFGGSP